MYGRRRAEVEPAQDATESVEQFDAEDGVQGAEAAQSEPRDASSTDEPAQLAPRDWVRLRKSRCRAGVGPM